MTLNTWVAGNPGAMRAYGQAMRGFGTATDRVVSAQYAARNQAASEWEGQASEAFQGWANRQGRDGDALAQLFPAVARAVDVWSDGIDTVKSRMEQAKKVARDGRLRTLGDLIYPPKAPSTTDNLSGTELKTPEVTEAGSALQAKMEAAYAEAQATVEQARDLERGAHKALIRALDAARTDLKTISQAEAWERASAHPTSPAGAALADAAVVMESRAADATKGMFEQAATQGPAAVHAAWSSLSVAQKTDLIDRFPEMVGRADGVPTVDRDAANRSIFAAQRQALIEKLSDERTHLREDPHHRRGLSDSSSQERIRQLEEALAGINDLQGKLGSSGEQSGYYLLGIDSTADSRGRAIVASGNPDTASHVLTYVPGTFSDLGGVDGDLAKNQAIFDRAQQLAPQGQKVATIVWEGYESPPSLPEAAWEHYANNAKQDLSEFQQGLRATHEGSPSHNTVLGHSYGSTVVGYAARDHGLHADDIAFLGSPGVGVDNARDLGVPPERVWAGTSDADSINSAGPPGFLDRLDGVDDQWFGVSPSDPTFDGNLIPTDPTTEHSDYWLKPQTVDELARIISGQKDVQQ
jgi:uncharacterized protein YukE/pimeloyl-ACP methyl ester carboxylesterase